MTAIRSAGYNLVHGNISPKNVARYGTVIQQEGTPLSEIDKPCCSLKSNPAGGNTSDIAQLRRMLERDPKSPSLIVTV